MDNLVAVLQPERLAHADDYELGIIFNTIRTTQPVGKDLRNALHRAILSDQVSLFLRATLLSALTLNVLETFDADLLECMYTYTLDDQPAQLRQQSWTALFLCGMVYDARIAEHPRLSQEYLLLCESEPKQLMLLQELLLPIREFASMKRELLKFMEGLQQGNEAIDEELHQKGLKLFVNLLHSKIDTGYTQFKYLSSLGFFSMENTDHHWLMPFDKENEVVKKTLEQHPKMEIWYEMLLHNVAQTHTDKYATFLVMSTMPEKLNELDEKLREMNLMNGQMKDLEDDLIMQIHLQDLFRFYTLSKTGKMLNNPFRLSPDLSGYKCFGEAFMKDDNLLTVGRYLLKAGRFDEAAQTFKRLVGHGKTDETMGSRIMKEALEMVPDSDDFMLSFGKWLNRQGWYAEALNVLYKAFLTDENNEDLIKELAATHLLLGQDEKAEKLMDRLA